VAVTIDASPASINRVGPTINRAARAINRAPSHANGATHHDDPKPTVVDIAA